MSATAIINALMLQQTGILALVPASRIFVGIAPQATQIPAILITEISAVPQHTISRMTRTDLVRARVQVTVYSKTYAQMKKLLLLAKMGGGTHTGWVGNYYVNSVLPEYVGPEILPMDDGIYEQSRDFMVTFAEAN